MALPLFNARQARPYPHPTIAPQAQPAGRPSRPTCSHRLRGPSAEILGSNRDGAVELIISERLIVELTRALAYPKLRKRIPAEKAAAFVSWVREHPTLAEDPPDPAPVRSPDPDDDYLLALAISRRAFLITGDQHLLGLRDDLPILPPAEFLARLREDP